MFMKIVFVVLLAFWPALSLANDKKTCLREILQKDFFNKKTVVLAPYHVGGLRSESQMLVQTHLVKRGARGFGSPISPAEYDIWVYVDSEVWHAGGHTYRASVKIRFSWNCAFEVTTHGFAELQREKLDDADRLELLGKAVYNLFQELDDLSG